MSDADIYDAIVVGAGPAGSAAAITMARAGLKVLLLEKGERPGSKNVMGGILYTHMLREVVGDAWKHAPLERPIVEEQRWMLTENSAIRVLGYKDYRNREHAHSYSVLRAKFDPWFAEQAEKAGAELYTGVVADELLIKNGRVAGILSEGEAFEARCVVVCEGVGLGRSLLERAGLKKGFPTRAEVKDLDQLARARIERMGTMALAVKEIIKLDPQVIEDRFNCEPGEGASVECYGAATKGMAGFMFIYTNRDTLSVGGGVLLKDYVEKKVTPYDLLEHFKNLPAIRPLLRGGETVEYLAKQIPEAGYDGVPRVYGEGYLVCGDAAALSNPVHREGSNLAMTSGRLAGETVIHAKERGDFSARTLSEYRGRLDNSWIIPDMKKYNRAVPLLENNPQFLTTYPELLDQALRTFFTVDGVSKSEKQRQIRKLVMKQGGLKLVLDSLKAARALKIP